jgi:TetR/AcrR family transcriptional repressor of nem operon
MARAREFDYRHVLDQALQLLWKGGYEATALDDMLGAMQLSKSSFYAAFGSKHQLLLAAVDRYVETVLQANVEDLARGSPREAILRSFDKIIGLPPARTTCFLQVCAIERGGHDTQLRARVRQGLERLTHAYRDAILRGQSAGEFSTSADAGAVSTLLVSHLYGLQVLGRAGIDAASRRKTLDLIMNTLS